jgi:tRNA(Ile)-lysidine synthase
MINKLRDAVRQLDMVDLELPIVMGVSGGPDSLAMFHALCRLELPLIGAYFDHGLRPEAVQEAHFVHQFVEALGGEFAGGVGDVPSHQAKFGLSIEEAARQLRYAFLFEQARRQGAGAVVTAHTADDQVETVIMHLLRGAGLSGLKGMLPFTILPEFDPDIPLIRPGLNIWRSEVMAYCQENGLKALADPSNQDITLFRNRIRHELVPLLETYNPTFKERLQITSLVLARDEAVLQALADESWGQALAAQGPGYVGFRRDQFLTMQEGLQARLVRRAIFELDPSQRDVDFETTLRALKTAKSSKASAQCDLVGGLLFYSEAKRVWICRSVHALPVGRWPQLTDTALLPLASPVLLELDGEWRLEVSWRESPPTDFERNTDPFKAYLGLEPDTGEIEVRTRRPGDRFHPLGLDDGSLKLSDFFINAGLPKRLRDRWPLVCVRDQIAWVPGLQVSEAFRIGPPGKRILFVFCSKKDE